MAKLRAQLPKIFCAIFCAVLCACSTRAEATPVITVQHLIPTARPTRTPRPTPEVRNSRILTFENVTYPASTATDPLQVRGAFFVRTTAGIECLGEVINNSTQAFAHVQIHMTLRDKNGVDVMNKTALVARNVIGPNQTSPFRVHFSDPPVSANSVEIAAIPGDPIDIARTSTVETRNITGTISGNRITIRGEIITTAPIYYTVKSGDSLLSIVADVGISIEQIMANNPDISAETLQVGTLLTIKSGTKNIQIVATIYDSQQRVIGYRIKASQQNLAAGAIQPFEISVVAASPNIATWSLTVEAVR